MLVFSTDEENPKKWKQEEKHPGQEKCSEWNQTETHLSAQEECAERKETQRSNEDSGQRSESGRRS